MLCVSLTQKVSLFQHKNKAISSLAFLPVGKSGACVCPEKPKAFGQASGKLVYHAVANQSVDVGAGAVGFAAGKCAPYPATTMIPGQNPTCDIRHYRGGQWACHHMWSLLDAEQDIPWPDQKLVFHHKYRFWVQPFTEGYHTPVHYGSGSQLLIGSPWEYDVPKCAEGMAGCSRRSDGTWIHTVTGSKYNNEEMVTLNFHCHAPTCLDMSVYACPMGMSLDACGNATSAEEAEARGYKLLCKQEPVYGGSGNPHVAGTRFDETGCERSNGRAQPPHHACRLTPTVAANRHRHPRLPLGLRRARAGGAGQHEQGAAVHPQDRERDERPLRRDGRRPALLPVGTVHLGGNMSLWTMEAFLCSVPTFVVST